MTIPAGTVGGVMGYHRGWVGDRNVVSVGFNWVMGEHTVPPKPLAHGHVIQVFGLPNMRTVLHCLPPEDWTEPGFMGLGMIYTAMPVTNAVPYVVAAEPGIVTLADLPPVTGRLGPDRSLLVAVACSCRSPGGRAAGRAPRRRSPSCGGQLLAPRAAGHHHDLAAAPADQHHRTSAAVCQLEGLRGEGSRSASALTASTRRGSSGSTRGLNRATTVPSAATRNFSKFQVTSPASPFSLGVSTSVGVDLVPVVAVDVDLLGHREGHAVRRGAELRDLLGRAGLLAHELVARQPDDGEPRVAVGLLELLEPGVLRGQAALAGDVDQQRGPAAGDLAERRRRAVEAGDLGVEDAHASDRRTHAGVSAAAARFGT